MRSHRLETRDSDPCSTLQDWSMRYENLILLQKWQHVDSAEHQLKKSVACCHFWSAYDTIKGFV